MTTAELLPTEYTRAPDGVLHIIPQHPDAFRTVCGIDIHTGKGKTPWEIGDETQSGCAATCFACWLIMKRRYAGGDALGNFAADEGIDKCPNCGCKYWEHDTCIDCGMAWHPSFKDADDV